MSIDKNDNLHHFTSFLGDRSMAKSEDILAKMEGSFGRNWGGILAKSGASPAKISAIFDPITYVDYKPHILP